MQNHTSAVPQTGEERPRLAVLLVDDQRFVGIAVGRLLAAEPDIDLHCCQRAADAVALANQIRPDVILQDLVLPDIDGLTMVRLFRANASTADTPIIVLSGDDRADMRARALAEGANDYIVKLPARDAFISCIRRHAVAGTAHPVTAQSIPTDIAAAVSCETLDRSVMARFRASSPTSGAAFAAMLIDGFVDEASSLVQTLGRAQLQSDWRVLKSAAHSLKGSSMTIGATRLAALCTEAEDQHADGTINVALMTAIVQEFHEVRAALAVERQEGDRQ
jgi:CheY-like chemotaxis protein/HPt (histidine-containing phosphotransfer) domain-containing protein